MKKNYNVMAKVRKIIPKLALLLAVQSVSSTCFFCLYQPDIPTELTDN